MYAALLVETPRVSLGSGDATTNGPGGSAPDVRRITWYRRQALEFGLVLAPPYLPPEVLVHQGGVIAPTGNSAGPELRHIRLDRERQRLAKKGQASEAVKGFLRWARRTPDGTSYHAMPVALRTRACWSSTPGNRPGGGPADRPV